MSGRATTPSSPRPGDGRQAACGAACALLSRPPADAGDMTPAARLAELGAILALGYRRHRLRQKALDDAGERERSCPSVDSPENSSPKEVA